MTSQKLDQEISNLLANLDKYSDIFDESCYIKDRLPLFGAAIELITAILAVYNPERIPFKLSFDDESSTDVDDEDPINTLMCECFRYINYIRILLEIYPADNLIKDCLNIGWEENHHDDPDALTADEAIAELESIITEIRQKDKHAKEFIKKKLEPLYDYFDDPPMDLF